MRLKNYINEDDARLELLLEKTFAVSKDVKYLYDRCFKGIIDDLHIQLGGKKTAKNLVVTGPGIMRVREGKYNYFWKKAMKGMGSTGQPADTVIEQIMSEELPSKQAKEASKANPVVISCGIFRGGNYYRPKEEFIAQGYKAPGGGEMDRGWISLSLHGGALGIIMSNSMNQLPASQLKAFMNEFTDSRIKATIAHEISHWMNDTFHNFHITKDLRIARELNKPEYMKLHKKDVNMTHFEIDAQIHGIKQLKMQYRKRWDEFTLKDVYFFYNSLRYMGGQIYANYGKQIGDIWQKLLVKRMVREKLLGKNMKGFAKYPEDFK